MSIPPQARGFVPYPFEFQRHAPPSMDACAAPVNSTSPVAIVGGGIAGLTLALGLAVQGVRSVVIEADDSVCHGSRAICFSRRSLEIFERLGVLEPILSKGLAWTGGRSFYRDTEVLRFEMPHDAQQKLPPMINLQQYHVEDALVRALRRHADLVDLRWQSRVARIVELTDAVELQIEQPGASYPLRAAWVAACDGARSCVREAAGLRLEGTAYEGRYVVADIALRCDLPTERLAWFDPPSNPGSTILMHRQPDDVWRIDYQLRDDEDGAAATRPENVLPRVEAHLRMMGLGQAWAPIWISLYKANALTLPGYRRGRCLFVGDAAHLVPIFGVRGANSTIDDADNLAWKLALVVREQASPRLLDSYSDERVHAARENLAYGTKSTQFMAPPDFAFRTMREAVLSLATTTPAVRSLINPRQTSPIRYGASPLNATPGEATGSRAADGFAAGPPAGTVLTTGPVEWIDEASGSRPGHLTDALRAGAFTAVHFATSGAIPDALKQTRETLRASGIELVLVSVRRDALPTGADRCARDPFGTIAASYGVAPAGALYTVRPDGHVLGRWSADPQTAPGDVDPPCIALGPAIRRCLEGGYI